MLQLMDFLFNKTLGRVLSAGVGLVALVASFFIHNANQRAIGARTAHAATERANAEVSKKAAAAAARSVDPAARGMLNPRYRAD